MGVCAAFFSSALSEIGGWVEGDDADDVEVRDLVGYF